MTLLLKSVHDNHKLNHAWIKMFKKNVKKHKMYQGFNNSVKKKIHNIEKKVNKSKPKQIEILTVFCFLEHILDTTLFIIYQQLLNYNFIVISDIIYYQFNSLIQNDYC